MQNLPETDDFYKNPPQFQLTRLIIWMGVIGLGVCFMPLFLISSTLRDNYQSLKTQVESIQGTLDTEPVLSDTDQSLRDELLQIQTVMSQVDAVKLKLVNDQVEWASLMSVIGSYDPYSLALTGIMQNARQVTLNGKSIDETAIMHYTDMLRNSGLFEQVTIQMMMQDNNIATPVPATPDTAAAEIARPLNFTLLLQLKANES